MTCILKNCNKKIKSRGLCSTHWRIAFLDVLMGRTTWEKLHHEKKAICHEYIPKKIKKCLKCDERMKAKKLCAIHYGRKHRKLHKISKLLYRQRGSKPIIDIYGEERYMMVKSLQTPLEKGKIINIK